MFPRRLPKDRTVPAPALAPASGFARGLAGRETVPPSGETETGPSMLAFHLERYPRLPKLSRIPSMRDRIARLTVERLSRLSQAACLHSAEALDKHSSKIRAATLRYLIRNWKILRFQVFRPSIEGLSCPFRCPETAPAK